MFKFLKKGISTSVAIGIILVLAIFVGGVTYWQYQEMQKEVLEEETAPEEEPSLEEKEKVIPQAYQLNVPRVFTGEVLKEKETEEGPGLCYLGAFAMLALFDDPDLDFTEIVAYSGIGVTAKNVVPFEILPINSSNLAPASRLFSLGIGCPDSIQGHARVLSMCPALVIIKADLICSFNWFCAPIIIAAAAFPTATTATFPSIGLRYNCSSTTKRPFTALSAEQNKLLRISLGCWTFVIFTSEYKGNCIQI